MKLFLFTRITFESIRDDILNCWKELGETLVIISGTGTEAEEMESGDSKWLDTNLREWGNKLDFSRPVSATRWQRFLLLFDNTKPQSAAGCSASGLIFPWEQAEIADRRITIFSPHFQEGNKTYSFSVCLKSRKHYSHIWAQSRSRGRRRARPPGPGSAGSGLWTCLGPPSSSGLSEIKIHNLLQFRLNWTYQRFHPFVRVLFKLDVFNQIIKFSTKFCKIVTLNRCPK